MLNFYLFVIGLFDHLIRELTFKLLRLALKYGILIKNLRTNKCFLS